MEIEVTVDELLCIRWFKSTFHLIFRPPHSKKSYISLAPSKPTQKKPQLLSAIGFYVSAHGHSHIIPFYPIVIETMKSTNAGIRNNSIAVELLFGIP